MNDAQRTIARARLLRRTGKTYDEIRAALGISAVSDDRLKGWLRGISRRRVSGRSTTASCSWPAVVAVFMRWLALLDIPYERCRFRIAIHETADVASAHRYWAAVLRIFPDQFQRATIKRHRPTTNRLNYGDAYYGCLTISVLQSAELYRSVAGWWAGLHAQATTHPRRSAEWSGRPPWLLRSPRAP
jgi:hypothetical protein